MQSRHNGWHGVDEEEQAGALLQASAAAAAATTSSAALEVDEYESPLVD
jgi:hypothetical protein